MSPPRPAPSTVGTSCVVLAMILLTALGLFVVAVGCSIALQVVNR